MGYWLCFPSPPAHLQVFIIITNERIVFSRYSHYETQENSLQPECNNLFLTEQEILWHLIKRCLLRPALHLYGHSISLWDKHTESWRKRIRLFMKNTPPSHQYLGSADMWISLRGFYLYPSLLYLEAMETGISTSRRAECPRSPSEQGH